MPGSNPDNQGSRLRILFVISDLAGGGAERAVSTLLRHLDRERFEPGLCLWRSTCNYAIPDDVPLWVLGKTRSWHVGRVIRGTARVVDSWRPDYVWSHLKYVNIVTGLALRFTGWSGKWFPTFQSNPARTMSLPMRRLAGILLRRSSRVLAVSEGSRRAVMQLLGLPPGKTLTLYNPVDFAEIDRTVAAAHVEKSPQPTLVALGRLTEAKDYPTMFEALARVRQSVPARLIVFGEGPLLASLTSLVKKLGLKDAVEFRGFVKQPFAEVASCDVFVLSSRWEGLPTALIEAMALGLPCVATRCPYGPEEIITHGQTGLLVRPGDPGALAAGILEVLRDSAKAQQLGRQGRASVRARFSPEGVIRSFEQLLAVVEGRCRGRKRSSE